MLLFPKNKKEFQEKIRQHPESIANNTCVRSSFRGDCLSENRGAKKADLFFEEKNLPSLPLFPYLGISHKRFLFYLT